MPNILPGQSATISKQQAKALMATSSDHALATGLGPIQIRWMSGPNNTGAQEGLDIFNNVVPKTTIVTEVLDVGSGTWVAPSNLEKVVGLYSLAAGGNGGNGVINTSSGASGGSGEFSSSIDFADIVANGSYEYRVAAGGSEETTFLKLPGDGRTLIQANPGTNANGTTPGVGGTGGVGYLRYAGTDGSPGVTTTSRGGSGGPGAPGPFGQGKAGGIKTTGLAGAGGGGANGGLSTAGNNNLGGNNTGGQGGRNRLGVDGGAGGTASVPPGIGENGAGSGGSGQNASTQGKGADSGFEIVWTRTSDNTQFGPGGGPGGGASTSGDTFAGAGGNGKFGAGGAGGASTPTKRGLGGTGGDGFIVIKYTTGALPELSFDDNLYPSIIWDGTPGSGWVAGAEPQTTVRGENPQPMVTCNFVDWLTYSNDYVLAINAEAVGGIDRVEVELEGNKKTIYFKTLKTIIGRNGTPRSSWAYHVTLDHAKAMEYGFDRGICSLRITAYAKNPIFEPRTLPAYTVYPRENEWDTIKTFALNPIVHPVYGVPDYVGENAIQQAATHAADLNNRLKMVGLETGVYDWDPSVVSIDNPNYWITICGAEDVTITIGDGTRLGTIGDLGSQIKIDMLHFMGENLEFDVAGMAKDGGSAITQRTGTKGRYWFDGCWLKWGQYNEVFSSGTGAEALVKGRQPSPAWLYAGIQSGSEVNTFFTEVRVPEDGAAASGIARYRLAWYCDIPYCSGTAYENPMPNSSTYYCSARKVGGYLPYLRTDNTAFYIRYAGAGSNPTLKVLRSDGAGATNGTADRFILTVNGVSDTYTITNQGHDPATFIAWANGLGKGWVLTEPETPCRLSLSFVSRETLDPAQPWGIGLTDNTLPITSTDQRITCKMDIHANCIVTTPGKENQYFFGFHGETVGAAPFSCGTGVRKDYFMVNFSFIDKGHLFVDPNTGSTISAQQGYMKSGSGDHHVGIWYGSMPQSSWFYGTGGEGSDPAYAEYGYNSVYSIAAKRIGYLAPSPLHTWENLALHVETQVPYVASIGAINSVGYGTGTTNQSTVTLEQGFVDPVNNLTAVNNGWLKLPDGAYAGRYRPDGTEQAIPLPVITSPQIYNKNINIKYGEETDIIDAELVGIPDDNLVTITIPANGLPLSYHI